MPFKSTSPMVYRVRPVKDTNKLILSWQLPPQGTHYRSDPSGLVSPAHIGTEQNYLPSFVLTTY